MGLSQGKPQESNKHSASAPILFAVNSLPGGQESLDSSPTGRFTSC